jgi:hypothetical protein
MTRWFRKPTLLALLGIVTLLLMGAFVVDGAAWGAAGVLLIATAWGVLLWRNGRVPFWPGLLLVLAAALSELPAAFLSPTTASTLVWRYLGVIGVLLLWDLSRFQKRLGDAADTAVARQLISAHLRRLGLLVGLALAALAVQQRLPISFNFDLALLSGLVLAIGLYLLLQRLHE